MLGLVLDDPVLVDDWHVVARSADVVEGRAAGVRLLDEDLVLWRAGGRVLAWRDLCVHRGARLSLGTVHDGTLACAYHGWTYDPDGRCVRFPAHPDQSPPATARATTYRAVERFGWVWVSLGDPDHDVAPFAQWQDGSFRKVHCGPYRIRAATIECVNAQARSRFGLQQLRVRGLRKVRCVALWIALTHNLLLWITHCFAAPTALGQAA